MPPLQSPRSCARRGTSRGAIPGSGLGAEIPQSPSRIACRARPGTSYGCAGTRAARGERSAASGSAAVARRGPRGERRAGRDAAGGARAPRSNEPAGVADGLGFERRTRTLVLEQQLAVLRQRPEVVRDAPSPARRPPRAARPGPGSPVSTKARASVVHRARLVRLVLRMLERRRSRRPAGRSAPATFSQTAATPRDDGASPTAAPGTDRRRGRIIVLAMSSAHDASMFETLT